MKANELRAYLAGFLDGEGTISIARIVDLKRGKQYPRYRAIFQIGNTVKAPLELFQNHYGGTVTSTKRKKAQHLQFYVWRVLGGLELDKLLTDVVPFLIVKKEQAQLVIQLRERIRMTDLSRNNSGQLQALSQAEYQYREALYKRLKALNALSPKPRQFLLDLPSDDSQAKLL